MIASRRRSPRRGVPVWLLLVVGLLLGSLEQSLLAQPQEPQPAPPAAVPPPPAPTPLAPASEAVPAAAPQPTQAVPQQVPVPQPVPSVPPPRRFQFTIDPGTPLKDLLPTPPAAKPAPLPLLVKELAQVPEVEFQAPLAKDLGNEEQMKQTAHMIARINHLNGKKADGFLDALRGVRLDLAGLPFAMGDACRTKGERSRQFANAVATVRAALQQRALANNTIVPVSANTNPISSTAFTVPVSALAVASDRPSAESFWEQYQTAIAQEDKLLAQVDHAQRECVTLARVAALVQILAPESPSLRLGLVKYLATVSHVEATRALARMALFSAEDEVRQAALEALKVRRERDYTDVLVKGLRYPWPAVARRAGEAIVKLERTDLLPQLVALLDEPDPRAPVVEEVDRKPVPVVHELVRINHHRNCMLCHAPGNTGAVSPEALTAAVPVPSEPLPSPSDGYRQSSPDLLIRVDVTYLRQDFSVFQAVTDANPWPEMQRFDFLVRTRTLTDDEAKAYRQKLQEAEPDRPSPYQQTALLALRELTGRDTEPTPAAWRRLLKLPAKP